MDYLHVSVLPLYYVHDRMLRMKAEVVSIGTELLLGEIIDTNAATIARSLRKIGVDLFFKTTVGDNVERAKTALEIALGRADVIITTGGLGPTVDDVTREAVARATNRQLEFSLQLLDQIASRFARWGVEMSQNNRQQAYIPAGSIPLENPVGTAPCFIVESDRGIVISLPGVPREMENLLENQVIPYLVKKMDEPAVIVARILRTAGIGESRVDVLIDDLEHLSNPTVGLAAHSGQTDIRITAKAASENAANMILDPLETEIRKRLGENIYGTGNELVEDVVLKLLKDRSKTLALAEGGTAGTAGRRLNTPNGSGVLLDFVDGQNWADLAEKLELGSVNDPGSLEYRASAIAKRIREQSRADIGLSVLIEPDDGGNTHMASSFSTRDGETTRSRGYAGPPESASTWASTTAFDLVRRWLIKS